MSPLTLLYSDVFKSLQEASLFSDLPPQPLSKKAHIKEKLKKKASPKMLCFALFLKGNCCKFTHQGLFTGLGRVTVVRRLLWLQMELLDV